MRKASAPAWAFSEGNGRHRRRTCDDGRTNGEGDSRRRREATTLRSGAIRQNGEGCEASFLVPRGSRGQRNPVSPPCKGVFFAIGELLSRIVAGALLPAPESRRTRGVRARAESPCGAASGESPLRGTRRGRASTANYRRAAPEAGAAGLRPGAGAGGDLLVPGGEILLCRVGDGLRPTREIDRDHRRDVGNGIMRAGHELVLGKHAVELGEEQACARVRALRERRNLRERVQAGQGAALEPESRCAANSPAGVMPLISAWR